MERERKKGKREGKRKKRERISYLFPKGKEYFIFSPNRIYQKNMHNLFGGKNIIFIP